MLYLFIFSISVNLAVLLVLFRKNRTNTHDDAIFEYIKEIESTIHYISTKFDDKELNETASTIVRKAGVFDYTTLINKRTLLRQVNIRLSSHLRKLILSK